MIIIFTCVLLFVIIALCGKGLKQIFRISLYNIFSNFHYCQPYFCSYSPVLMSIICVVLSTIVTLMLLNGASKKTYSAIVATVLGVVLSAGDFI